jgi:hypothetical protein
MSATTAWPLAVHVAVLDDEQRAVREVRERPGSAS